MPLISHLGIHLFFSFINKIHYIVLFVKNEKWVKPSYIITSDARYSFDGSRRLILVNGKVQKINQKLVKQPNTLRTILFN